MKKHVYFLSSFLLCPRFFFFHTFNILLPPRPPGIFLIFFLYGVLLLFFPSRVGHFVRRILTQPPIVRRQDRSFFSLFSFPKECDACHSFLRRFFFNLKIRRGGSINPKSTFFPLFPFPSDTACAPQAWMFVFPATSSNLPPFFSIRFPIVGFVPDNLLCVSSPRHGSKVSFSPPLYTMLFYHLSFPTS